MEELRKRLAHLTPEIKSLLALRLQEKQTPRKDSYFHEPIAVTGIGCRFPGGVMDTFSYWRLLSRAEDAIGETPSERWNVSAYYDANFAVPGKMNTRWGGFLDEIDKFDPKFFNISPREAVNLDPQQRLLLEICWEALRDASILPESLNGSSTGVFIGISAHDYMDLQLLGIDSETIDAYYGTGSSASFAAGRISYWLGAQGPSIAVDTACSSSLVAVHLACQSLRTGECRTALAGGVNLILSPLGGIYLSQVRALSPNGKCQAFSAEADGIVRGEGCGIVVLKRLSDALHDKDRIWAVIRGSAVNQDGRSNGLTAPNGLAQEAVIKQALANGQVKAEQIGYIEAHGTGTPLGDPIEIRALQTALEREKGKQPLMIGSVKTNIGHLEAAAGIAGLIKTALSLNQKLIPASLHFKEPNPHISWNETSIDVSSSLTPWILSPSFEKRIAGVSSFGFSGTNAHVIIEEFLPSNADAERVLAPTAQSPWKKERYWIVQTPRSDREIFGAESKMKDEVCAQGVLLAEEKIQENTELNHYFQNLRKKWGSDGCFAVNRFQLAPLIFFTAQRNSFFYVNRIENSLIALIYVGAPENLSASIREFRQYAERRQLQPKIFILEDDLSNVEECGLTATPCGVQQEISDLEAFTLNGNRMRRLRYAAANYQKHGKIEVKEYFSGNDQQTAAEIEEVINEWMIHKEKPATFVEPLKRLLQSTDQNNNLHRFFVTERNGESESLIVLSPYGNGSGYLMDLEFYRRNAPLGCIEFGIVQIIEKLKREGFRKLSLGGTFGVKLETFPLEDKAAAEFFRELHERRILNGDSNYQFKTKFRPQEKRMFLCQPHGDDPNSLYDLLLMLSDPLETRHSEEKKSRVQSIENPLLGKEIRLAAVSERIFETRLNRRRSAYLWKHRLRSRTVLPGTAFLEILQATATAYFKNSALSLQDVLLHAPLFLDESEDFTIQLKVIRQKDAPQEIFAEIYSLNENRKDENDSWQLHITARISAELPDAPKFDEKIADVQARCHKSQTKAEFYRNIGGAGFEYGTPFQGIEQIHFSKQEVVSLVELPTELDDEFNQYDFHPALFDACLQTMIVFLPQFNGGAASDLFLLKGLEKLRIHLPTEKRLWCYASRSAEQSDNFDTIRADLFLINESGEMVASIEGIEAKQVSQNFFAPKTKVPESDWFYKIGWEQIDLPSIKTPFNKFGMPLSEVGSNGRISQNLTMSEWLIFGNENCELTRNILELLIDAGISTRLVLPDEKENKLTVSESFATLIEKHANRITVKRIKAEEVEEYADSVRIWEAAGAREKVVVWLWSAETVVAGDSEEEMVGGEMAEAAARQWAESARQCRRLLFLMQSLAETFKQAAEGVRLWVVRAEAASSASAAARAGVLGMGRVFSREHPQLWGGAIEVDLTGRGAEAAREICNEIVQNGGGGSEKGREEEVAYRGGKRYAARLRRADLADLRKGKKRVREDGWYLISGGLGGLGLAVCEWLLEEGAGKVVLGSRRAGRLAEECAPWRAQTAELAKRFGKARVSVRQMDVSEWEEVRKVIREEEEGEEAGGAKLKLRGVIQSAGEVADALLERQDAEKLERVLRAKAAGGWNLHYATLEAEMDFFVLFSSAVVILGNPGQINHAAANSILDGLAEYRKAEGLTALSINWGIWDEIGAAVKTDVGKRAAQQGIETIKTAQGLAAFERILETDETQIVVLPTDWKRWQMSMKHTEIPALFNSVTGIQTDDQANSKIEKTSNPTHSLKEIAFDNLSENKLRVFLRQIVSELLDLSENELDDRTELSNYGFDSLMAIDLRSRLQKDLKVNLTVGDLFLNLTLTKLHLQVESQLRIKPVVSSDDLRSKIEQLSEAEIDVLLKQKLAI